MEEKGKIMGKFEKYRNFYGTLKYQLEKKSSKNKIIYFDYNI